MTNIISFQKPGITRITAAFFAAFALCDIGSIHPADIFSVLIFAGMLLLFSPTLTQRLTNIGAASSVLPRHFYPICRLLAVLYTLFYAAAKHAEAGENRFGVACPSRSSRADYSRAVCAQCAWRRREELDYRIQGCAIVAKRELAYLTRNCHRGWRWPADRWMHPSRIRRHPAADS